MWDAGSGDGAAAGGGVVVGVGGAGGSGGGLSGAVLDCRRGLFGARLCSGFGGGRDGGAAGEGAVSVTVHMWTLWKFL